MRVSRFPSVCGAALGAFLLAATASRADSPASNAAAPKAAAPKSASAKPAPAKAIRWRMINSGEAEAKKTGKPALYFFTAEWCGPCHLLQEQVFSDPDVMAQVEKDFVPVVVQDRLRETGKNAPEMLMLADRYALRGFPTLVVSRPKLAANVTLEGWEGRAAAVEFLRTARKRFLDVEKKIGAKK